MKGTFSLWKYSNSGACKSCNLVLPIIQKDRKMVLQYLKSCLVVIQYGPLIRSNSSHRHSWFPKHVHLVPNKILWVLNLLLYAWDHWGNLSYLIPSRWPGKTFFFRKSKEGNGHNLKQGNRTWLKQVHDLFMILILNQIMVWVGIVILICLSILKLL